MTQHDYIRIARAIRLSWETAVMMDDNVQKATIGDIVYQLCKELESDNPLFDGHKFRKAAMNHE